MLGDRSEGIHGIGTGEIRAVGIGCEGADECLMLKMMREVWTGYEDVDDYLMLVVLWGECGGYDDVDE